MNIEKINLYHFRNYDEQEISLGENVNIIYGDNAQGKTNIIESIFLCSMGKSFRSGKDSDLIRFGEKYCKVKIDYKKTDREGNIETRIEDKKVFLVNGIKQNKVSDIIGKINVVIFTPDDIDIIKDGPQKRRRFLDMMISSLRPNYIHVLNQYNKALEQRNNYLKQIKTEGKSPELLDIWDEQLANLSSQIYEYRKNYTEKIAEKIEVIHNLITKSGKNSDEIIKVKYISTGKDKESFKQALNKSRNIDIIKGYTAVGIHRDDLIVYVNHKPVSTFGSQGQKRTAILSLKLCELQIVKEEIGESPILLLDDFMSELDENRRTSFLENIEGCQVILTCTDKLDIKGNVKTFYVEGGKVKNCEGD
jgi:DNA replication and repair protein RecF